MCGIMSPPVPTAVALADHWPLGTRRTASGHVEVGGCDLVDVARELGTPAYVVAEDDLRVRARRFADGLAARRAGSEVLFASKAFPATAVLRVFAEEGLGCDVASGGELHTALHAGFDPERITLHGNAKSEEEVAFALRAGVGTVVLDSFDDIARVEALARRPQDVLIRVTPGVEADTHHAVHTGHAGSKFGIGLGEAREAIARVRSTDSLRLRGLHMHIGSQLFDLDPFRAGIAALMSLGDWEVLDVGGGLGASYLLYESAPSVEAYLDAVVEAVPPGPRIVLEPGRALVANACVTLYTVETVKHNVSTWVAVDGGMSDNLRPMLYDSRYEAAFANRRGEGDPARLAGKHCESGDVLVWDTPLGDAVPGDLVVTPATGAYGHALANNYNGVPRPPVVFCSDGDARVVVRRETYDDLLARDL